MPLDVEEKRRLLSIAKKVRTSIIQTVYDAGSGHVGGSLSQTDLLVALYHRYLKIDPTRPDAPDRDRFVLSKGHGGLGLCPILANLGFIDAAELRRFGETGFRLGMHMDRCKVPGIESSTGSLGHGLGVAVGLALGAKVQGLSWRTYCMISDGECYEGSIWEAVMAAAGFRLGHLAVIVDRNRMTMDGCTEDQMPLEPLGEKLKAFGWRSHSFDGHDFDAICEAFDLALADESEKPVALIGETTKGKGVSFMENVAKWHYGALDSQMFGQALESINKHYEAHGISVEHAQASLGHRVNA